MRIRRTIDPTPGARGPARLAALAVLAVTVLLALGGCTADGAPSAVAVEPPHRLTAEQADQLARIRFVNHSIGIRGVRVQLPKAADQPALDVVGYYDFTQHLGYAKVEQIQDGGSSVLGLVSWTPATIGVADATRDELPLPIPDEATPLTPLDPRTSTLNTLLAIIANLGADQSENSDLLEQSDALWLRSELFNGVPVSVYAGTSADAEVRSPAAVASTSATESRPGTSGSSAPTEDRPLEYWVTSAGELRRVQKVVDTGAGDTGVAVIDFLSANGVSLVEPTGSGLADSTEPQPTDPATPNVPPTEAPPAELAPKDASPGAPLTGTPFTSAPLTDAFPTELLPTNQNGPG